MVLLVVVINKLSSERIGYDGFETLFKESINGKPRATRCKKKAFQLFYSICLTFQREVTCKL